MTEIQIDQGRLAKLDTLTLDSGAHVSIDGGHCALELVSWLVDEPWSDRPQCVSPVIAAFGRSWNDGIKDTETRTRLIRPLLPLMIGTATTSDDEETRAWMATDWLARVCTPAWLRLAGLVVEAQAIEATARIVDAVTARAAQPALNAGRDRAAAAAAAAWDAAGAAAWDAARAAAWDAAGGAAWDAAWDAAAAAAGAAAWDAARAAAWDAAGETLAPTVALLQESAVELLTAMCAVGTPEAR